VENISRQRLWQLENNPCSGVPDRRLAMSVHYDRARDDWVVRWREAGRQRARRFSDEAAARVLEARVAPRRPAPATGGQGGVYVYETSDGPRWRYLYRQSDGRLTSRRGFTTRAAATAARATAVEQVRRGDVRATSDTFAEFWAKQLEAKRPYVTAGTLQDYATHGVKRLLPWFGGLRLTAIDEDRVRVGLTEMAELVADGELSAKTVNNARTCLSMTLGEAVRPRHLPVNPCRLCARTAGRADRDRLPAPRRDRSLPRRLRRPLPRTCRVLDRDGSAHLRGARRSLTRRRPRCGVVRISRQRARGADGTTPTKGKRFRSVQIGPRLVTTLQGVREARRRSGMDDGGWLFLCPAPRRGRYSIRTKPTPPSRKAAHDWHEWALEDAGLRDMPLHSLRHTAATAWLSTGHPLIFVQRQLGHRSITTTEEHYGHLELSFVREAAARTEELIASAARRGAA
jgi:integrase